MESRDFVQTVSSSAPSENSISAKRTEVMGKGLLAILYNDILMMSPSVQSNGYFVGGRHMASKY